MKAKLIVHKSNKYVYAQVIVGSGKVVAHQIGQKTVSAAKEVGVKIAKEALKKKIKEVAFDRSSYKYHGIVKAVADGAREGGLKL